MSASHERALLRYAVRSLGRNARRTALSVLGIAFGVGVALFGIAWIRGEGLLAVRAAGQSGVGHVRVAPHDYLRTRDDDLRLEDGAALLARIRALPGVEVATPHARSGALVALGTRSVQVDLVGVDPETEPAALRFVRHLSEGRYLASGVRGEIVLGRALVERLGAAVDDELVVMSMDEHGDMQSAVMVLVGVASSGSEQIDLGLAQVGLTDLAAVTGRGEIAEITVVASDMHDVEALEARVRDAVGPGVDVLSWQEVSPSLVAGVATDTAFMNVAALVVLVVVLLGVASAQLTAVLERKKELAVLAALGMRAGALVRVVLFEGAALGLLGALGALAWAAPLVSHYAEAGIDLRAYFGDEQSLALGGVLLDPVFYPEFGGWFLGTAALLSLVATLLASLYPAIFAARTDPANALRADA